MSLFLISYFLANIQFHTMSLCYDVQFRIAHLSNKTLFWRAATTRPVFSLMTDLDSQIIPLQIPIALYQRKSMELSQKKNTK